MTLTTLKKYISDDGKTTQQNGGLKLTALVIDFAEKEEKEEQFSFSMRMEFLKIPDNAKCFQI